jgi:hypothetical protein
VRRQPSRCGDSTPPVTFPHPGPHEDQVTLRDPGRRARSCRARRFPCDRVSAVSIGDRGNDLPCARPAGRYALPSSGSSSTASDSPPGVGRRGSQTPTPPLPSPPPPRPRPRPDLRERRCDLRCGASSGSCSSASLSATAKHVTTGDEPVQPGRECRIDRFAPLLAALPDLRGNTGVSAGLQRVAGDAVGPARRPRLERTRTSADNLGLGQRGQLRLTASCRRRAGRRR